MVPDRVPKTSTRSGTKIKYLIEYQKQVILTSTWQVLDTRIIFTTTHPRNFFTPVTLYDTWSVSEVCQLVPVHYLGVIQTSLVPWSPWSPWYIGGLSQLPVVKMSWGKKSKKQSSVYNTFCFLVNFIRHAGPMVTLVTTGHKYTGGLFQLPVVEINWGKT